MFKFFSNSLKDFLAAPAGGLCDASQPQFFKLKPFGPTITNKRGAGAFRPALSPAEHIYFHKCCFYFPESLGGLDAIFSPSTKARNELAARHFLARNKDGRAGPLIRGGDGCIYTNGSNHRLRISAGFY